MIISVSLIYLSKSRLFAKLRRSSASATRGARSNGPATGATTRPSGTRTRRSRRPAVPRARWRATASSGCTRFWGKRGLCQVDILVLLVYLTKQCRVFRSAKFSKSHQTMSSFSISKLFQNLTQQYQSGKKF